MKKLNPKNHTQYRQGDVLIEHVILAGSTDLKHVGNSVILAEGEATGHAHTLECETIISRQDNNDGSFFLTFSSDAEVTHQEHNPIVLAPGTYRVTRQREYAPGTIRSVAD